MVHRVDKGLERDFAFRAAVEALVVALDIVFAVRTRIV
jgi:hypothetical protein